MGYLIDEYLDHLRAYCTGRTVSARGYVLRALHDALPLGIAYATTEQLEAWVARPVVGARTRAFYGEVLRHAYGYLAGVGLLDGDPAARMGKQRRPGRVPRPVSDVELAAILDHPDPWWHRVCVLAAYAGLRVAEIAACRREDVGKVWLRVPLGKGDQPGAVPTHPLVWQVLADLPEGLVAPARDGRQLRPGALSTLARRHFDQLGMPRVHLHRLRHWYGTEVQRLNKDIRVTQVCLRHKHVGSTQGYAAVADERTIAAVVALPVPGAPAGS